MPHVEKMGYRSFTIYEWMWSDRGFCNELLSVARKDAIFLNRDHPLSEQKDDLWRSDPAQKGRNHADEWAQKVREGKVHTPLDRTYFLGLNEPDSNHYQRQIDAYNEAFCRRMAQHGLRAAAYSFGVGHPSTVGLQPKAPVDWSWYDASAAAILEGDHIAAFHEYGEPNGYGWGHWCNRLEACPHPFNVVLDECGIDHGVLQSGYLYGWAIALKPEEYVAWLDAFQLGMAERAHTRKAKILAYNIFSFDHGRGDTKDWHSFDIRPLRSLLESYRWSEPAKQTTHIPIAHSGPTPVEKPIAKGTVTAHLLNIRGGADTNAPVVGQLRQGDTLNIYEIHDLGTHAWYRIGNGEWVHSGWVQRTDEGAKPVQEPQPVATGIIDPKVAQAILKIESGGRTHGNDGRIIIRFEAHVFKTHLGNDALWAQHFSTDAAKPWTNQQWRRDADSPIWAQIHTGDQANEWAVFDFARSIDVEAACKSISMGAAQILGSNHARIGYPSAKAMFDSFQSAAMQTLGFVNYCLSDAGLIDAIRRKDWRTIAAKYNGSGAVDTYAPLLESAYQQLGG